MQTFMDSIIFLQDYQAEKEYFEEKLQTALVNNKPGFVKLYLKNGAISIEKFLTKRQLRQLYTEVSVKCLTFRAKK